MTAGKKYRHDENITKKAIMMSIAGAKAWVLSVRLIECYSKGCFSILHNQGFE
jgi:hypothetical protein